MVPPGYGNMRTSTADRERAVDVLKAAFAEGRLDQAEYADRVGQVYTSRTYAELAALTSDLPVGPLGNMPPVAYLPPVPYQAMLAPPMSLPPAMPAPGVPYYPMMPAPPAFPVPQDTPRTNGMAIAAFVFSLGTVVTDGYTAPLAIALGIGAAVRIRRTGELGSGLAVAAVILATLQLLIILALS